MPLKFFFEVNAAIVMNAVIVFLCLGPEQKEVAF